MKQEEIERAFRAGEIDEASARRLFRAVEPEHADEIIDLLKEEMVLDARLGGTKFN